MVQNHRFIFSKIPQGAPVPGQDLTVDTIEFDVEQAPPSGGVTLKNVYASLDPYMRGRMWDPKIKSYTPALTLEQPVTAGIIAKVLKSDNDKFQPGDLVSGFANIEEYSALPKQWADTLQKVNNPFKLDPIEFTGPLGMPGLTAYSSLYEIGKPKKGETIFISAASGAVGALVGQIAKHEGLKVIGSVGSDEKLKYITEELGFDAGFNYKNDKPKDALKRLAPDGIDIYYENVGGEQLEAAIESLNDFGRIVACGMISDYNKKPEDRYPIKNLFHVVSKRITFRGFIQGDKDFGPAYKEQRDKNVAKWLADGTFKSKFDVVDGVEKAPQGLVDLLDGKNFGKVVVKIADI